MQCIRALGKDTANNDNSQVPGNSQGAAVVGVVEVDVAMLILPIPPSTAETFELENRKSETWWDEEVTYNSATARGGRLRRKILSDGETSSKWRDDWKEDWRVRGSGRRMMRKTMLRISRSLDDAIGGL